MFGPSPCGPFWSEISRELKAVNHNCQCSSTVCLWLKQITQNKVEKSTTPTIHYIDPYCTTHHIKQEYSRVYTHSPNPTNTPLPQPKFSFLFLLSSILAIIQGPKKKKKDPESPRSILTGMNNLTFFLFNLFFLVWFLFSDKCEWNCFLGF